MIRIIILSISRDTVSEWLSVIILVRPFYLYMNFKQHFSFRLWNLKQPNTSPLPFDVEGSKAIINGGNKQRLRRRSVIALQGQSSHHCFTACVGLWRRHSLTIHRYAHTEHPEVVSGLKAQSNLERKHKADLNHFWCLVAVELPPHDVGGGMMPWWWERTGGNE